MYTSGGGLPDTTCKFDFHKQKVLPITTVTLYAEGNLSECTGKNTVIRASRMADVKQFPVGISYTTEGSAVQGEDFSRLNGFLIIPAESIYSNRYSICFKRRNSRRHQEFHHLSS